jgi:hypothetical protein
VIGHLCASPDVRKGRTRGVVAHAAASKYSASKVAQFFQVRVEGKDVYSVDEQCGVARSDKVCDWLGLREAELVAFISVFNISFNRLSKSGPRSSNRIDGTRRLDTRNKYPHAAAICMSGHL